MIYLVTGFMRSGTSLMMQALEAGGLPVVRNEARDQITRFHGGFAYEANPAGLYEVSPEEMEQPGFPRQHDGRAVKVVVAALGHLAVHDYRVVCMHREARQVVDSAWRAFRIKVTAATVRAWVDEGVKTLDNRRDVRDVQHVAYENVLADPALVLKRLDWPIDAEAAAKVVKPELWRCR